MKLIKKSLQNIGKEQKKDLTEQDGVKHLSLIQSHSKNKKCLILYSVILIKVYQNIQGCLNRLVNWLPRLILAVGCCLIFAAFIQSLNMAFAIGLMAKPFDEDNAYANKNIEGETKQLNPKKE